MYTWDDTANDDKAITSFVEKKNKVCKYSITNDWRNSLSRKKTVLVGIVTIKTASMRHMAIYIDFFDFTHREKTLSVSLFLFIFS